MEKYSPGEYPEQDTANLLYLTNIIVRDTTSSPTCKRYTYEPLGKSSPSNRTV